jgi:cytochrome b561
VSSGGRSKDAVATTIGWMLALLLLAQIPVGYIFHAMNHGALRDQWFTWHKSLGAAILLLALLRLAWGVVHRQPTVRAPTPAWERLLRVWTRRALYVLLIALPATGLLSVWAWRDPGTLGLVGGWALPMVPVVPEAVGDSAEEVHKLLATLLLWTIGLHLLALVAQRVRARRAASSHPRMYEQTWRARQDSNLRPEA